MLVGWWWGNQIVRETAASDGGRSAQERHDPTESVETVYSVRHDLPLPSGSSTSNDVTWRTVRAGEMIDGSVFERIRSTGYTPPNLSGEFVAGIKARPVTPASLPYTA